MVSAHFVKLHASEKEHQVMSTEILKQTIISDIGSCLTQCGRAASGEIG